MRHSPVVAIRFVTSLQPGLCTDPTRQMQQNVLALTGTHRTQPHISPMYLNYNTSVSVRKHFTIRLAPATQLSRSKLFS